MPQTDQELREHLLRTVMGQVSRDDERRREALRDYLAMHLPNLASDASTRLAELIPPVLPDLYRKWAGMFVDRLFETVPREQIMELCDGSDKNNATIILVYVMFLESERMEKQMEEDLKEYGRDHSGDEDLGGVAADFIRASVAEIGASARKVH